MTRRELRRIVVVGASAAGLVAAETLRREGFGGSVTVVGDELHDPYDRPPLSKQILSGAWPSERSQLRSPDDLGALDVQFRLGVAATALNLESHTVALADGHTLGYDGLIIATGVRPRRLQAADGVSGVHVMRSLDDALALRERLGADHRLVVVGAGFLGTEVAATSRALGARVTLVEPAPVPLAPVLGDQVGAVLGEMHRERGVDVRVATSVTEVLSDDGRATGVRLSDGTEVPADDVLVAIGSNPNTEWLEGSGLTLADGVVCDEYSAAATGVYAAGDVARWHNPLFGTEMRIEHRTNAAEQGVAAARNLLHPDAPRPFAPIPYFWSDQYDVKVQAYGYLRGHEEVALVDGDFAEGRFLVAYRRGDRLVGVLSVGMPPKLIHGWRKAIGSASLWHTALGNPLTV
ncbi:FAD-dependent oxidoreductase [Rhodococcus sp. WS4]|nr:FAD-dependent oxidoreductase [Rhodococcus sp. WS4]